MFAILHQRLDGHFDFMNHKAAINRHFNADDSRQLIDLIDEIRDAQQILKRTGIEFMVVDYYREVLEECGKFLNRSGGSAIPENFGRIELVRYERVFVVPDTRIRLQARESSPQLPRIGSGSYANVYQYTDPEYGTLFALKRRNEISTQGTSNDSAMSSIF